MIIIYRLITIILYPFIILLFFLRTFKYKEDAKRYKEKIFFNHFKVSKNKNLELLWFHAASLGEVKSIFPIINKLDNTKFEFLITTVTLSSAELVENKVKKNKNIHHRFFPVDIKFLIKKFLLMWKPKKIFLVDSEIWPNLILSSKEMKIPISLLNARITKKTFSRWMLVHNFAKRIFSSLEMCLASNLESENHLKILGARNVVCTGNIKLISHISIENIFCKNEKFLSSNKVWCAASTHKGEEEFCLKTHLKLKTHFTNIFTVLAPRHIKRVSEIKKLCHKLDLKYQVVQKDDHISGEKEIIIINSFGILNEYFKYVKSVFMGKSLLKKLENVGGQNPIDAAKLGCKIYYGPYTYNFKEIYEFLNKNEIAIKVASPDELAENLLIDLKSEYKDKQRFSSIMEVLSKKTLNKTMERINFFLSNEIK